MSNITLSVKGRNENETRFVATARHFQLIVDEPEELGGTDQAANSLEFLLAAYAGCLNVMGHIVAKEMGIGLRSLAIDIEGDMDQSKLIGRPSVNRPGYQEIRVKLTPDTDADPGLIEIWAEAVEARCPVNDNLLNPTPVHLEVVTRVAESNHE